MQYERQLYNEAYTALDSVKWLLALGGSAPKSSIEQSASKIHGLIDHMIDSSRSFESHGNDVLSCARMAVAALHYLMRSQIVDQSHTRFEVEGCESMLDEVVNKLRRLCSGERGIEDTLAPVAVSL